MRPPNYLARDLLIDLEETDTELRRALQPVFADAREFFFSKSQEHEDYPFFSFGSLLLAQRDGEWTLAEDLAHQLIEDESAVRRLPALKSRLHDPRFLLGLTRYDQLHDDWLTLARPFQNPTDADPTQRVIDALEAAADGYRLEGSS